VEPGTRKLDQWPTRGGRFLREGSRLGGSTDSGFGTLRPGHDCLFVLSRHPTLYGSRPIWGPDRRLLEATGNLSPREVLNGVNANRVRIYLGGPRSPPLGVSLRVVRVPMFRGPFLFRASVPAGCFGPRSKLYPKADHGEGCSWSLGAMALGGLPSGAAVTCAPCADPHHLVEGTWVTCAPAPIPLLL